MIKPLDIFAEDFEVCKTYILYLRTWTCLMETEHEIGLTEPEIVLLDQLLLRDTHDEPAI